MNPRPFPHFMPLYPALVRPLFYENTKVLNLLEFSALKHIGLISYSLYLWHWPIISFLNRLQLEELNRAIFYVGLTYVSSICGYFLVERKFWNSNLNLLKVVFYFLILPVLILIGLMAVHTVKINSINSKLNYNDFSFFTSRASQKTVTCRHVHEQKLSDAFRNWCNRRHDDAHLQGAMIIGDSNAAHSPLSGRYT